MGIGLHQASQLAAEPPRVAICAFRKHICYSGLQLVGWLSSAVLVQAHGINTRHVSPVGWAQMVALSKREPKQDMVRLNLLETAAALKSGPAMLPGSVE